MKAVTVMIPVKFYAQDIRRLRELWNDARESGGSSFSTDGSEFSIQTEMISWRKLSKKWKKANDRR